MGEYAMFGRERVKIGTCEDMYYLRADQARAVTPEKGSLNPADLVNDILRAAGHRAKCEAPPLAVDAPETGGHPGPEDSERGEFRVAKLKTGQESGFAVIVDGMWVAVLDGITAAFTYGRGCSDRGARDVRVRDLSARPEHAAARAAGKRIAAEWRYDRAAGFLPVRDEHT